MRPELSKELFKAVENAAMGNKTPYLKSEKGKLFAHANALYVDDTGDALEVRFYHDKTLLFSYRFPANMGEHGTLELSAGEDELSFFCRLRVGE